ncbi:MAG TPA: hypothetical protein VGM97_00990 [Steroidobacteraceae bacterium]
MLLAVMLCLAHEIQDRLGRRAIWRSRDARSAFDEATSMLDSLSEEAILRSLDRITADRTTIIVAHRLSTIQHADEIVVLAAGNVVERGNHASLLARDGTFAAMWRAQCVSWQGRNDPRRGSCPAR